MHAIIERILTGVEDEALLDKLVSLSGSDLSALLLAAYKLRTAKLSPAGLLNACRTNRFTVPSELDPIEYHRFEAELLGIAEEMGIRGVLLSPCEPLGACSVFGCVDQNNVLSASRGTEILSDPTNMLALLLSYDLKSGAIDRAQTVHRCTSARVARAQAFSGKGYFSHFGIFCIVSRGRDCGSYGCEKELLAKQLAYYKRLTGEKYLAHLSVTLRKRRGYADGNGFFQAMAETVRNELSQTPLLLDACETDNNYYKGVNFKLYMEKDGQKIEIGDGGFVDWIAKMTNNQKERCLISGLGLDRMLLL